MKYQLTWNPDTESGFVMNDVYKKGYAFEGIPLKPLMETINYEAVVYDTINDIYKITISGTTTDMTDEQKLEAQNACFLWIDNTYIPTAQALEIYRKNKYKSFKNMFSGKIEALAPRTPFHEMASWQVQESEAKRWDAQTLADKTANVYPTPFVDALLTARNITSETKQSLVDIIIFKSNAYKVNYGAVLGEYHATLKLIEVATTQAEIDAVEWQTYVLPV